MVLLAWMLVGSGMIVLLAAANRNRENRLCKQVVVNVKGDAEKVFIEKSDIAQQLKDAAKGSLIKKPIIEINLAQLGKALEKHAWIQDAELYFDSRDVLHVSVWEREPVARVFTTNGQSYYLDSAGQRLPLLQKVAVRVPVVTNFTAAKKWNRSDSILLKNVTTIAQYLNNHSFWSAQIAQIDITPAQTFELIPVIGSHVIRIGTANNLAEKMDRLFIFYKQVAVKTGFDKYAVIDVQYNGQVIGSKNKYASVIDSIQLQKNIQALIEKSRQTALQDSLTEVAEFNAQVRRDSTIKNLLTTLEEEAVKEKEKLNPKTLIDTAAVKVKNVKLVAKAASKPKSNPVKTNSNKKPVEKPKPKAVMKRKEVS